MRDARDDWQRFDAGAIPTKESTPHLDAFLDAATNEAATQDLIELLATSLDALGGRVVCGNHDVTPNALYEI